MRLRRARPEDVPSMLEVKASLRFEADTGATTQGGFLLGTDAAGYLARLAVGSCWVLEERSRRIEGFAVVLPDAPFRASEVWGRREAVAWEPTLDLATLQHRLCYYDQLAVRRGPFSLRRWASALALTALAAVLDEHDHLVTATVTEPVVNLAAVPYLRRLGGRVVGRLDEHYPDIGPLVSDIWLAPREAIRARLHAPVGLAEAWVVDAAREALS